MSVFLSASEIFEIAIQIERNGAAFYRKAARSAAEEQTRQELNDLAAMEDMHQKVFTDLMCSLITDEGEPEWYDADGDEAAYLESFASGEVFDMTQDLSSQLSPTATLRDVLRLALERERDSVVFFVGLQRLIPPSMGRDQVEAIVDEELGHITLLSKRYAELVK